MDLPLSEVLSIVSRALAEDLGWGDITTDSLIAPDWQASGQALAKEPGVLAGIEVMALVFTTVDPSVRFAALKKDGEAFARGDVLATVSGPTRSLLSAERVALNFVQRLSGIATETSRYVEAVKGLPVRIVETRKTTPGLRLLEKYAVRVGGGHNHRQNLSDGVLIKDNHLAACKAAGLNLAGVIERARQNVSHMVRIEVEVESVAEAIEAAEARADVIMLDNMSNAEMRRAVEAIAHRAQVEASGGVRLDTVRAIAETGVDLISVGALTHSVKALDISLDFTV